MLRLITTTQRAITSASLFNITLQVNPVKSEANDEAEKKKSSNITMTEKAHKFFE